MERFPGLVEDLTKSAAIVDVAFPFGAIDEIRIDALRHAFEHQAVEFFKKAQNSRERGFFEDVRFDEFAHDRKILRK